MKSTIYLLGLALTLFYSLANANLVKVGAGTVHWGIFKLYDAQFFTEPNLNLSNALSDQTAARLELCFTRSLTIENFVDGANHFLPSSLSPELQQAVNQLHAAYQPVKEGDCYHLDYQPEKGTRLLLNNRSLAQIKTPGFKNLYFGIWIGNNPLSNKLKQNLTQDLVSK